MTEAVIDADTLYQESSLATGDTLACLFDNQGQLESGNHHFDMCFGNQIRYLSQLFSGNDEAFYQKLSRLDEVVAEGECRTLKGMRWFQYQFRHIQQGPRSCSPCVTSPTANWKSWNTVTWPGTTR